MHRRCRTQAHGGTDFSDSGGIAGFIDFLTDILKNTFFPTRQRTVKAQFLRQNGSSSLVNQKYFAFIIKDFRRKDKHAFTENLLDRNFVL